MIKFLNFYFYFYGTKRKNNHKHNIWHYCLGSLLRSEFLEIYLQLFFLNT